MKRRTFLIAAGGTLAAGSVGAADQPGPLHAKAAPSGSVTVTEAQLNELLGIAKMLKANKKNDAAQAVQKFRKRYRSRPNVRIGRNACTLCVACQACGPLPSMDLVEVDGLLHLLE